MDQCAVCGGTDIIFGQSHRNLTYHNDDTYHTECLIRMLGGTVPKYIVVYVNSAKSYLCKLYGDHYEVEAEGNSTALKKLADALNGESGGMQ